MLQKLSIIRALLADPDILLLDEPISGLDPIGIKQVRDLIVSENREGRTIFISSHQLSEMERICHRVAIISRGRLVAEDNMKSLLARISRDREIHVDLDSIPRGLEARLAALPSILGCASAGNTLVIKVPKEGDFRRTVSEFLIGQHLVPLRIQEKTLSLEEAFLTITQDNVERLTTTGGDA
jgi:ABC-type multidrug transport system ATPase subunit